MGTTTTSSSTAKAAPSEGPGDGSVYGAFVSLQLDDQRSLKDSLESRAAGVITSSGVLVTLLFGLAAITTHTKNFQLPSSAHIPLIVALGAFVSAFGLAVAVGVPFRYKAVTPAGLEQIRIDKWRDREWVALRRIAGTEIVQFEGYLRANRIKAWLLLAAGASQLVALVALGITVALILWHG